MVHWTQERSRAQEHAAPLPRGGQGGKGERR